MNLKLVEIMNPQKKMNQKMKILKIKKRMIVGKIMLKLIKKLMKRFVKNFIMNNGDQLGNWIKKLKLNFKMSKNKLEN